MSGRMGPMEPQRKFRFKLKRDVLDSPPRRQQ